MFLTPSEYLSNPFLLNLTFVQIISTLQENVMITIARYDYKCSSNFTTMLQLHYDKTINRRKLEVNLQRSYSFVN